MSGSTPKARFQVRFRLDTGISYSTKSERYESLWDVVQRSMQLIAAGNAAILSIERVTETVEPLTESEADAVRLMTGGKVQV